MQFLKTITKATLVLMISSMAAVVADAVQPGAIELKATASKLVVTIDREGIEQIELVAPDRVIPGDKIAYTIAARNLSQDSVEQVVITDPIPKEMLFVEGTEESEGARVLFSVDGGQNFDREDRLVVTGVDGKSRPATSADFTHIRWVFETPIAPASERLVRFVAMVE